jgi:hypothetical protein
LYGKTKDNVNITTGSEFGEDLSEKNLILKKSLHGLKTSTARLHVHFSESLLKLVFKKTKYNPDLWIVDKSSHYEHFSTYIDDILIWSKVPMVIIKSLEKCTY